MRVRRSWTVTGMTATVLAMAVIAAMAAPASAAAVAPNIDTSVYPGNEAEDAIAVNPTDPNNIVTMSTLPDVVSGLFEGVSFDGGKTWTRRVIGAGTQFADICCDEQLAWDTYGNLWMTYLDINSPDVLVALSTDGGLTFRKAADIVPTTPPGNAPQTGAQPRRLAAPKAPQASADQPSISTAANSVWVSYTSFPSVVVQASGASVTGLGVFGSFSAPQSVPTSTGIGDYGDTAVGPGGQLLVTYQNPTGGQGNSHIYTALDPDGLGPSGFNAPLLLARSYVGGFDYIPAQPNRSVDAEANLAWDRSGGPHNGRVYAIWTQENGSESNDMDIMFQHSDDNGTTWSPAVRLNDDHTGNSQFNPAIALDQATGIVAVSWYDCRNDLGTGGRGDTDGVPNDDFQIWGTDSTNGGVTTAPNFQISQGTSNAPDAESFFDTGDYTHAAFQSHTFWPAWSDNSNSTGTNPDGTLHQFDLYTTKVTIR